MGKIHSLKVLNYGPFHHHPFVLNRLSENIKKKCKLDFFKSFKQPPDGGWEQ